jgi:hypothetical protein
MSPLLVCPALAVMAGCSVFGIGGPDQDTIDAAASLTCAEVRSGIAAFNEKDYAGSVHHFIQARPFAERYAELSDQKEADDLFEAVEYYAHLPAQDYRDAFAHSRRFLVYKKITLDQCDTGTAA